MTDRASREVLRHHNGGSRLRYAVRDSTLSFIDNLVESNTFCPEVIEADWYSGDYNRDPSVDNMVRAIGQISSIVDEETAKTLLEYTLDNVSFIYFDMQSRVYSEEQYVILNTTGYSLTPTEHIKPLLLGKLSDSGEDLDYYSRKWEKWENVIWQHRPQYNDNFTVDEWFDRLLTLFYLCDNAKMEDKVEEKAEDYTKYQKVLQGTMNYTFPDSDAESAKTSLRTIEHYFECLDAIGSKPVNIGYTGDIIENYEEVNIWDYIANNNWSVLANIWQQANALKWDSISSGTADAWNLPGCRANTNRATRMWRSSWHFSADLTSRQQVCMMRHGKASYSMIRSGRRCFTNLPMLIICNRPHLLSSLSADSHIFA